MLTTILELHIKLNEQIEQLQKLNDNRLDLAWKVKVAVTKARYTDIKDQLFNLLSQADQDTMAQYHQQRVPAQDLWV